MPITKEMRRNLAEIREKSPAHSELVDSLAIMQKYLNDLTKYVAYQSYRGADGELGVMAVRVSEAQKACTSIMEANKKFTY